MTAPHLILKADWERSAHYSTARPKEESVREIEQCYGIALPEDFRAYLLLAAPREEYWDDGDILWWPPEKIRNIPEEYDFAISDPAIASAAATYLFFADFLIWSWAWAICCGDGPDRGKVAIIGGDPDRIVAPSFTAFVEAAVRDSMAVS